MFVLLRTIVSYTTDVTVKTNRGVLKTHNVGIFDFATGLFTEIARIDPNTSSGRFAGATGVLFTSSKTTDGGATFESRVTGEICLAHDGVGDDDGSVGPAILMRYCPVVHLFGTVAS
ncbi:MAG: hypothetical protein M3410_09690 [Acidobacteriota bacterium]|nr:hypothetical protein [Acidobacteriota bacterium]